MPLACSFPSLDAAFDVKRLAPTSGHTYYVPRQRPKKGSFFLDDSPRSASWAPSRRCDEGPASWVPRVLPPVARADRHASVLSSACASSAFSSLVPFCSDARRASCRNAPPKRPRVIAVVNQKGGVGKTTTAVNLAASVAAAEKETLLLDMDPQGNASSGVGVRPRSVERSVYDALIGRATLRDVSLATEVPTLDVAPATQDLVAARARAGRRPRPRHVLKALLAALLATRSRVRVRVHRLPAVARPPHGERAHRGRSRARAAAVRVLRARGAHAPHGDDRPREERR